jgi:DNA replicative helicase MCM subunit Mcm2 (Cdc46/Mcm family)
MVSRSVSETDRANGLGNRFLWIYVKRSGYLPEGGNLTEAPLKLLATRLQQALDVARKYGGHHVMTRDTTARALWHKEYARLTEGYPGMFGAMTARSEAQVMRIACIYALLGCSDVVREVDLEAALEVWRYCEDSVRFVFGDVLGDPVADSILRSLRTRPDGMTRTDIIVDVFSRHIKAEKLSQGLDLLRERQFARCEVRNDTGGRAEERWFAVMASDDAKWRMAS